MALGPSKLRNRPRTKAERIIDHNIRLAGKANIVSIDLSRITAPFSSFDWAKLKPKYKKAGWKKADYVLDRRDGDYIYLEA